MTYQDPDPMRDRDLNPRATGTERRDYSSNAMWGWIAGAVVLVLVLAFLFGGTDNAGDGDRTATVNTPPAANNAANPPRSGPLPSETTGQNRQ